MHAPRTSRALAGTLFALLLLPARSLRRPAGAHHGQGHGRQGGRPRRREDRHHDEGPHELQAGAQDRQGRQVGDDPQRLDAHLLLPLREAGLHVGRPGQEGPDRQLGDPRRPALHADAGDREGRRQGQSRTPSRRPTTPPSRRIRRATWTPRSRRPRRPSSWGPTRRTRTTWRPRSRSRRRTGTTRSRSARSPSPSSPTTRRSSACSWRPTARRATRRRRPSTRRSTSPLNPDQPELVYNQAVELYNKNDFKGAEPLLRKVVEGKPDFAKAHYLLGMSYVNLNKIPDMKKHLSEYLRLEPKGADAGTAKEMLEAFK